MRCTRARSVPLRPSHAFSGGEFRRAGNGMAIRPAGWRPTLAMERPDTATDTAATSAAAVTAVTAVGDGAVTGRGMADGAWAGIGDTRMITATTTRTPATITIPTRRPYGDTRRGSGFRRASASSSLRQLQRQWRRPAEDQQQGASEALQYLLRSAGGLLAGRLSKRPAAGRPCRRGCAAESQGPRIDFVGLVRLGQLPPAASEAHAAMALGPIADWKDLYAYYNDAEQVHDPVAAPWKRRRPAIPSPQRTISCWGITT